MPKVIVELDGEQIDSIIVEDLTWHMGALNVSLKQDNPLVFEKDPVEDKKKIKELMSAMRLVLSWYGVKK